MRLPGFLHMKDRNDPFMVTLAEVHPERRYTVDEVLAAYPVDAGEQADGHGGASGRDDRADRVERGRRYAEMVPPAVQGQHGDEATYKLCAALVRDLGLDEDEAVSALNEWNSRCTPPWSEEELRAKVRNAMKYGQGDVGVKGDGELDDDGHLWSKFSDARIVKECVPVLDQHFTLLRCPDGAERVFSINDRREVTFLLNEEHLKQRVYDDLKAQHGQIPPNCVISRTIDLWKKETAKLNIEPEPFSFKGTDLCFKRFDWEPYEAPFPAWEEFLSRLSDRGGFMAYVWSCFERDNVSRQYVYLRGDGQDGKSVVFRCMGTVFGKAACAVTNAQITGNSRFVYSLVYGTRVVLYADAKNTRVGMTEFIRNVTGGDPVPIEFKNKTPFTTNLRCKLFIASNSKPELTSQQSDLSRMIYIEVAPSKNTDDPSWEQRLMDEMPGFLFACREEYRRRCPRGGDILVSEGSRRLQEEAAAAFEESFYNLFEGSFRLIEGNREPARVVSRRLRDAGLSNDKQRDFKEWMERKFGIKYSSEREGRFYIGVQVIDPFKEVGIRL